MNKTKVSFKVNGKEITLEVSSKERLIDTLRERLDLMGTKEGCGIGECGACTVIMNGKAVQSCMILTGQVDGSQILTIEGLEKEDNKLDVLQEAFIEAGAVQCGFCTPGMIMSSKALLQENPKPTDEEIKEALSGNICRCTGYKQIIEGVRLASEKMK